MVRRSIAGAGLLLGACTADASGLGPPASSAPSTPSSVSDGGLSGDGAAPAARGDAGLADGGLPMAPPAPPVYDWRAGDYPPDLHGQTYLELTGLAGQPGKARGYKVHVPAGYDPSRAYPVLFAFHGFQQNAVMFAVDGTDFVAQSDAEGYVLVMPNGLQEDGVGGSWNAGACCGEAANQKLDDVALIRAIFSEVGRHVHVDAERVYATGLSNGGFLSHRLACEAADVFAAVAPLAGAVGTTALSPFSTASSSDLPACTPSSPVAVLTMHGTADTIVPYTAQATSLAHWAAANGCASAAVPASVPAGGGDTTCVTYPGCREGVEVTGCSVAGGGHCWFGDPSCGTGAPGIGNLVVGANSNFLVATDAVWAFVSRFHR